MKKKSILLAALAAVLVIGAGAGAARAYFTARDEAAGGVEIELGTHTIIEEPEWVQDWVKNVVITNNTDSKQDVWVRAKAIYPKQYPVQYLPEGTSWTASPDAEGWLYYTLPLAPGQAAEGLKAHITGVPVEEVKDKEFNVTVVYEAVPVEYNSAGEAVYTDADWNYTYDSSSTRGGN